LGRGQDVEFDLLFAFAKGVVDVGYACVVEELLFQSVCRFAKLIDIVRSESHVDRIARTEVFRGVGQLDDARNDRRQFSPSALDLGGTDRAVIARLDCNADLGDVTSGRANRIARPAARSHRLFPDRKEDVFDQRLAVDFETFLVHLGLGLVGGHK